MPNEDKRRRLDGATTTQLSVAELIARREAETVEFPVITDDTVEPTVRFTPVTPRTKKADAPARELHITELLKREGRGEDASETSGFSVPKLVAAASGGVVLCGSVAFGASSWLSSPDERPLADVRFDERVQARGSTDNGVVKLPKTQEQTATGTESAEATQEAKVRVAPYTQQQQKTAQQTQAPTQERTADQAPSETTTPPSTTKPPSSETSTPPSSTTTPPPPSESSNPPSSSTPPSSTTPSAPITVDLGILDPILNPIGDFDFFAPAP